MMNYIITKSQLKVLIKEQNLTLPYKFSGSHTVPKSEKNKCDALHGFQLERINSNMNGKVKEELDKFSNQGVWVSDVTATVDVKNLKVDWTVTIDKSADGEFWNGFTSRGAGCNDDIYSRWKSEIPHGNGPESIVKKITNDKDKNGDKKTPVCKSVKDIKLVKKLEFIYQGSYSGYSFIQGFYSYKCGDYVKNKQPIPQKTSNPPIEKSITTTTTTPQKSITPVSTTTEKPITPASVPSQKPVTTPQTPNTGIRKKPITPLNVVSPEKYSVRIGN